ncbi:MAG: IS21 family transposase [Acidimicrobiia bacterium]|nr:IS21 family transposase [Acidimicrobiia bacterium]MDH4348226.1 IS21 family transposase [Gemmatimonadota bacterium]
MFEVREVLRLWLGGEGIRSVARLSRVDRKTVRRYVEAAISVGVTADGGGGQLTDEVLGQVVEIVRPHRADGHGEGWAALVARRDKLDGWVKKDLTGVKICELLARDGVVVAERTVQRFIATELGRRRGQGATVRVADGEPGHELQVDFARLGLLADGDRRRVCHALIFTAVFSRHMFVWLSFTQTTDAVIAGCEAAWRFFGGVFKVLIPDNLTPVVAKADGLAPRFNEAFVEYAQSRGFVIDPARVATPTDKPRVERMVQFVRSSFWDGEHYVDLADAQAKVEAWCSGAGMRVHGTTQRRPLEQFRADEAPLLLPAPTGPYDLPIYATCRVHRDHHIEIAKALYSVPGNLLGARVQVRADRRLVRIFHRSQLVKVHPRQAPGHRSTDPADLPAERTTYALRDIAHLQRLAAGHGEAIGAYAAAVLDTPLPWTKMRQVYALLGLVKKWGPERVNTACQRALDAEAISVPLIGRMLERATENTEPEPAPAPPTATRFARDPAEFTTKARRTA